MSDAAPRPSAPNGVRPAGTGAQRPLTRPIISGGVFDEFVLDVGPQHHEHDRRHHKARQYRNARLGEQAATNQFQAQRLVRAFEDRKYTGVDE